MDNRSVTQQSKADSKSKAIASFSLGIGSVILGPVVHLLSLSGILPLFSLVYGYYGALPFALIGLVFGIMGLNSTKRKLAIVGIILSIIVISISVLLFVM